MMKLKKIFLLTILSFLFIISSVNAAEGDTYTVDFTGESYDQSLEYNGGKAGGGYVFSLTDKSGKKINAYCISPLADNPAAGSVYKEVSGSGKTSSAYQSVFEQTCGDNKTRVTALKSAAYNLGESNKTNAVDETNGRPLAETIGAVYEAARTGKAEYKNGEKDINDLNDVVNKATGTDGEGDGSKATGPITFGDPIKSDGKVVVYANLNGNKVDSGSIKCQAYASSQCNFSIGTDTIAFTITRTGTCVGDFGAYIMIGYHSSGGYKTPGYPGSGGYDYDGDGSVDPDGGDIDGDGIPNINDTDVNGDGTLDNVSPSGGNGEGGSPGGSTCSCTPRYFELVSADGTIQELVSCEPTGGGSGESPGGDPSETPVTPTPVIPTPETPTPETPEIPGGEWEYPEYPDFDPGKVPGFDPTDPGSVPTDYPAYAYLNVTHSCNDKTIDCSPYDSNFELKKGGQTKCNSSGATVVDFYESGEFKSSKPDGEYIKECYFKDGLDYVDSNITASKTIFGGTEAPKGKGLYSTEKMCDVYCTEDYNLMLPGPTANQLGGDAQVTINSGSFFTIDDSNMKDKTTVKCYGNLRYPVLVSIIDFWRNSTVDEYEKYVTKEIVDNGYVHEYTDYTECPGGYEDIIDPSTGEKIGEECLEYDKDYKVQFWGGNTALSEYYKGSNDPNETGEFFPTTVSVPVKKFEEKDDAEAHLAKLKSDYANAENKLKTAGTEAKKGINDAIKFWKEKCLKWDISELNGTVYSSDNTAKINFSYYDGYYFSPSKATIVTKNYSFSGGTTKIDDTSKENRVAARTYCGTSGCDTGDGDITLDDADFNWASASVDVTYEFKNTWCNPFDDAKKPYIIDSGGACDGTTFKGFPVSIKTPSGLYSYTYDYSGIGHYFNPPGKTGRVWALIQKKYFALGKVENAETNRCIYKVNNCTICPTKCIGPYADPTNCDPTFLCSLNCQVKCVGGGCILDANAGFLATYRTISLNNPFPIAMKLSDPLDLKTLAFAPITSPGIIALGGTSDGVSSTSKFKGSNWETTKGTEVRAEIEGKAENVYNGTPEYKFVLDPADISKIKEYNAANPNYTERKAGVNGTYESKGKYSKWRSSFLDTVITPDEANPVEESYGDTSEDFTGPAKR